MPIVNVAGLTIDRAITKSGASYFLGPIAGGTMPLTRNEGSTDYALPQFAFDTGSIIPSGSTINSVQLQLRLTSWVAGDAGQVPEYRVQVALAKDFNAFGVAVDAIAQDYDWVQANILATIFAPGVAAGTKTFALPAAANSRVATAADIDSPDLDPEKNGWTEASLLDVSLANSGFGFITGTWATANNSTGSFRPVLIVDYSPPVGAGKPRIIPAFAIPRTGMAGGNL